MRIGIDVGGTHTDAVLLDGDAVCASCKVATTADVTSGIVEALAKLTVHEIDRDAVSAIMIGTTQFTNAVVERTDLAPVAAIRLGLPSGSGMVPMTGWPEDIAAALGGQSYMLRGGHLYDGRELAPLDDDEIDRMVADMARRGVRFAAITAPFSPMNDRIETHIAQRVSASVPAIRLTLSHEIGRIGLLERENAALLNAALLPKADAVANAFARALEISGFRCPLYVSQNDGTLMSVAFMRRFPALTFASGPTNSLRGAARLTGCQDAIVVDVGGTTSDIGALRNGFPRQAGAAADLGGVRTNFRMPDITALAIGGGSHVSSDGRTVGPRSVGHRLTHEALVFGGSTLTLTDIAVATGDADIGQRGHVAALDHAMIDTAQDVVVVALDNAIARMRTRDSRLPVILVGGGGTVIPRRFRERSDVLIPAQASIANAIGAAIAEIGGQAERVVTYRTQGREAAIAAVTRDAVERATAAGAEAATLRVAEIDEVAMPYMEAGAMRLQVKVVGNVRERTESVACA